MCFHESCSNLDDLLSLIQPNKIQEYDGSLEVYNDKNIEGFPDPGKIEHPQIHHFQYLSNKQYFMFDTFDSEELSAISTNGNYKYNIYIIEMPEKFNGIFVAAPYWQIISEMDKLISDRIKGRMLYCYAASEEVIKRIKVANLDGRLNLCSGAFHVGGASKIRNIQLSGSNILNNNDFSFIFDNPSKYVSTEIMLKYTKGLHIKTSLICETTGRFLFYHPKRSDNLKFLYNIFEYLIDNNLFRMTEIKPFETKMGSSII